MFLLECDVFPVQADPTAVGEERAGDGVEQSGLACPVAADNRCEIPSLQIQSHIPESCLLIDRSGIEGFCNMVDLKHIFHDESSYLYAAIWCLREACLRVVCLRVTPSGCSHFPVRFPLPIRLL